MKHRLKSNLNLKSIKILVFFFKTFSYSAQVKNSLLFKASKQRAKLLIEREFLLFAGKEMLFDFNIIKPDSYFNYIRLFVELLDHFF